MIPLEVAGSAAAVADAVTFAADRGNLADLLPDAAIHMGISLMVCLRQLQVECALVELEESG